MKKIFYVVLTCAALSFLVACSQMNSPTTKDLYNVKLAEHIENLPFSSSDIYHINEKKVTAITDSNEEMIKIGSYHNTAKLIEQTTYDYGEQQDIYVSNDQNIKYMISKTSKSFSVHAQNDTVLSAYSENLLTEEKLLEHVKLDISQYSGNTHLDEYAYRCYSSVVSNTEDSAWKDTKEGFYISNNENETVRSYRIEFREPLKILMLTNPRNLFRHILQNFFA